MYGHDLYYQSIDQPAKVVNPARGQLNRIFFFPVSPFAPEIWSRETVSALPFHVILLTSDTGAELGT